MKPVLINNIEIYPFSSRIDLINYAVEQKKSLIAINAEKILHTNDDTRNIINKNIGYADGIGAVWALKRKGFSNPIKIPGCELWLDIVRHFYQSKSFYLVGSKEEVIQQTVEKLKKEFPGVKLSGYRNGYIKTEAETQTLIKDIADKKPDVIFVAMGSPKQELLMQEMQQRHSAIYQGLGGSFDVYVGNVERAPNWWVKNDLEWAYRLVKQPKRILRQYVYLEFFIRLIFNKL
ncbi:MAG: WecB/TagA/CpsF family glycosyltransferase [Candidatus Delongbacteria bacterium]|jgi:UDP-N-acetyl-D-mannosaminouronate:lipid I N-acetyl-D-mannosaminouronosyltransferase|nr:WecB/TagA/CpsF family glycosyltransferase [Candidatus Delongbacteria bacterium]